MTDRTPIVVAVCVGLCLFLSAAGCKAKKRPAKPGPRRAAAPAPAAAAKEDAARKAYECIRLAQAPELDGEVDEDPAWKGVPVGRGYVRLHEGGPSDKQTAFRIGYTNEALYVAVVCDEPDPDQIVADMDDGEALWEEDSVELFISPDGENELQFVVNPISSRSSPVTLSRWQAEAYMGDGNWRAEIRLPWEVIRHFPEGEKPWGLNVCRNILSEETGMEHSTWALLKASFHEPENFGEVRFAGVTPELRKEVLALIEARAVPDERLVFSRCKLGVMLKTESSTDRVIYKMGEHLAPRLSPDAKRILFNSYEGGLMSVWIAESPGDNVRRLCSGNCAAWSPDGARIVLCRNGSIVERDLESGYETIRLSHLTQKFTWPCFCGDDDVVCTDEAGTCIYLARRGQRDVGEPLVRGEISGPPDCPPKGGLIAYQDGAHISVLDIETRRSRRITLAPGIQAGPRWALNGESLAYAQAPAPYSESWDIHHVEVQNPARINKLERGVQAGFDWHGACPPPQDTEEIPGASLRLWNTGSPLVGEADRLPRTQWKAVENAEPRRLDFPIAAENDWLLLALSESGVWVVPKVESKASAPLRIGLAGPAGKDVGDVSGLELKALSEDEAAFAVSFGTTQLALGLRRARPIVEVSTSSAECRVTVDASMDLAVVPDRLASDVIASPPEVESTVALPTAPCVLGLLPDPRGLLVLVTPSDSQAVSLVGGAGGFRRACVDCAGKSAFVCVLTGEKLWARPDVMKHGKTGSWGADWTKPFHAEWRLAARGAEGSCSRTWNEDALSELGAGSLPMLDPERLSGALRKTLARRRPLLPVEKTFDAAPECVVYLFGQDGNTPLGVLSPKDALMDTLGMRGYVETADVRGVRCYRCARRWVPYVKLATRKVGWYPWMAHTESADFGVLDIMSGLFIAGTPGVRSFAQNMGEDALALLEGLDERVDEYETALQAMESFCGRNREHDSGNSLVAAERGIREALVGGRKAPRTDVARAREALEAVYGILGRREGQYSPDDVIANKEEFKEFQRRCRTIEAERKRIIAGYRELAKQVCDDAASAVLADAGFKGIGDELRRRAHQVLRNRYYLEGDWRGETPVRSRQPKWSDQ